MILPNAVNLKDIDVKENVSLQVPMGPACWLEWTGIEHPLLMPKGVGSNPTTRHHPGTNTSSFHDLGYTGTGTPKSRLG